MSTSKKPITTRSKAKVRTKAPTYNSKLELSQSKAVTFLVFLFTALCIFFAILVLYRYGS